MSIIHRRRQYAVGQGFFHAGELRNNDDDTTLRYVYDCGAMKKYAASRTLAIDDYILRAGGAGSTLDILYISHAHEDHLNGVPQLLHAKTGLKVKTIMMPLVPLEERLISFARSASAGEASAISTFYRDFILDPVMAMGRFGPDRIIIVEAGGRSDGSPFAVDPNNPDGNRPDIDDRILSKENSGWEFYGRGKVERVKDVSSDGSDVTVLSTKDSLAVSIGTSGKHQWILAPYIDPAVATGKATFMKELADSFGKTVPALRAWLKKKANLESLLINHAGDLKQAYEKVSSDLNVTSLCLYSGPVAGLSELHVQYDTRLRNDVFWTYDREGAGWLGTGDAALKHKTRRTHFLKHYAPMLNYVSTLTLPHHGSAGNFHDQLISKIAPRFCVAAADKYAKWNHPGTHVVQRVASFGAILFVVTSDSRSELEEWVAVS